VIIVDLAARCIEAHTVEVARKQGYGVARVASLLDVYKFARVLRLTCGP
jgi:hypothetical protein